MSQPHLFRRDGHRFTPSPLTTGPWRADAMHGGPPAALVGWAVGQEQADDEHVARITVELERPVPLVPLDVSWSRRRVSGRVAHVDVAVADPATNTTVLSARALLVKVAPLPTPGWSETRAPEAVPPEDFNVQMASFASGDLSETYHRNAVEHRITAGALHDPGPTTSWVRLKQPVVLGEEPSGLCRVLAASDFGSGISAIFNFQDGVGLINADLTVVLRRAPAGEWIRIRSTTHLDPAGAAVCISDLADVRGELGVATQSLLAIDIG